MVNFSPLYLSFKLAVLSTLLLLFIGVPLAYYLARTRSVFKTLIESLVALPFVLPPTVLGFYLLLLFRPESVLGTAWRNITGHSLAFSFSGLLIASIIYSLPCMVQPLQAAFERAGRWPEEVAASLGASSRDRFFSITLPLAKRGLLKAVVLSFTHTLGEFGVVLMIGGSLPGKTQVASIAIYDQVEQMNYGIAHRYSIMMLAISFILLFTLFYINRRLRSSL